MDKMKIMLFGLNGRGGPLHYCSNLSYGLLKQGAEVHVLIPSYSNVSIMDKKIKLLKIKAPPNAFLTMIETLKFWKHMKTIKEIKKINPDVINILDIHPWYYLYWPYLKKYPFIVTINDPELHSGEAGWFETTILRFLTKNFLSRSKHIIVLGKKQLDVMKKLGYGKKDIFVSRIGNYSFFQTKRKIAKPDFKTVLFFGRIKHYKGIDILLKAFETVQKKIPNAKLLIVGEGEMDDYKEQTKKIKNIEVVNKYVPDSDVWKYFNRCSLVVMPYRDATQTGVVQIAYSFKRPVIATNVGSLPELVDDDKTGFVIPKENPEILAEKIIDLLKNKKKLLKFGENSLLKMKKDLNWAVIGKGVYVYYKDVLKQESPSKH